MDLTANKNFFFETYCGTVNKNLMFLITRPGVACDLESLIGNIMVLILTAETPLLLPTCFKLGNWKSRQHPVIFNATAQEGRALTLQWGKQKTVVWLARSQGKWRRSYSWSCSAIYASVHAVLRLLYKQQTTFLMYFPFKLLFFECTHVRDWYSCATSTKHHKCLQPPCLLWPLTDGWGFIHHCLEGTIMSLYLDSFSGGHEGPPRSTMAELPWEAGVEGNVRALAETPAVVVVVVEGGLESGGEGIWRMGKLERRRPERANNAATLGFVETATKFKLLPRTWFMAQSQCVAVGCLTRR